MLAASRSTVSGNAPETMVPPGIKRSTLFRGRDTCSRARRLDSRITVTVNNRGRRIASTSDVTTAVCRSKRSKRTSEKNTATSVGRPGGSRGKFAEQIRGRSAEAASEAEAKAPENSGSKIHLESGRAAFEELEGCRSWEWKVEESEPRRSSPGMSKLRSLRAERADLFTGLRSGLERMLRAVREMKSQQSAKPR